VKTRRRILYLTLPPILYLILLIMIFMFDRYYRIIGGFLLAYFIPPAGKESVIPLMTSFLKGYVGDIKAVLIPVFLITYTDAISAMFIIWNFDLLSIVPKIGSLLKKIEEKAKDFIVKYNLQRNTYVGLFIFVFIPFQGTGSTTASIIGKLLGLDSLKLFLTIIFASFLSSMVIALISSYLSQYFRGYTVLIVILLILLIGLIIKTIGKYYTLQDIIRETERCVREDTKK